MGGRASPFTNLSPYCKKTRRQHRLLERGKNITTQQAIYLSQQNQIFRFYVKKELGNALVANKNVAGAKHLKQRRNLHVDISLHKSPTLNKLLKKIIPKNFVGANSHKLIVLGSIFCNFGCNILVLNGQSSLARALLGNSFFSLESCTLYAKPSSHCFSVWF